MGIHDVRHRLRREVPYAWRAAINQPCHRAVRIIRSNGLGAIRLEQGWGQDVGGTGLALCQNSAAIIPAQDVWSCPNARPGENNVFSRRSELHYEGDYVRAGHPGQQYTRTAVLVTGSLRFTSTVPLTPRIEKASRESSWFLKAAQRAKRNASARNGSIYFSLGAQAVAPSPYSL
jgi:hypothetical protein